MSNTLSSRSGASVDGESVRGRLPVGAIVCVSMGDPVGDVPSVRGRVGVDMGTVSATGAAAEARLAALAVLVLVVVVDAFVIRAGGNAVAARFRYVLPIHTTCKKKSVTIVPRKVVGSNRRTISGKPLRERQGGLLRQTTTTFSCIQSGLEHVQNTDGDQQEPGIWTHPNRRVLGQERPIDGGSTTMVEEDGQTRSFLVDRNNSAASHHQRQKMGVGK